MNRKKPTWKGVQQAIKNALVTAHTLIIDVVLIVLLLIDGAKVIKYTYQEAFQPLETIGSGTAKKHTKPHKRGKDRHRSLGNSPRHTPR